MESSKWVGAVELQQQLTEAEQKLTQAQDRIADLERVRRQAQAVVREWPGLRNLLALGTGTPAATAFNDYVSYLAQAVDGRSSELPPAPRAPVAEQEYLQEVLLELWELVRATKYRDPQEILHDAFKILEQAVEVEAAPTMPDIPVHKVLHPAGLSYGGAPSEASKRVQIRRLRCEDDGPEYSDGTDADGFPGGDERMGVNTRSLVGKPVEGHPGIFTVELTELTPNVPYRLQLPETPKWFKMEPISPIDPVRGVIRTMEVESFGLLPKQPPPQRARRTPEQERTFRQLDQDAWKLNEIGREHLEWLRGLRPAAMPTTPERIVAEYGGPADGLTLAQRLTRIEDALGLDKDF
jgi:hypothetical protein